MNEKVNNIFSKRSKSAKITIWHEAVLVKLAVMLFLITACGDSISEKDDFREISITKKEQEHRVDIKIDNELFTTYQYIDTLSALIKPALFPLITPGGRYITRERGYPQNSQSGKRVMSSHQTGFWLGYGNVNGIDFWNHPDSFEQGREHQYGIIRHRDIIRAESNGRSAILETTSDWIDQTGNKILEEETSWRFAARNKLRIIERITTLKATVGKVDMIDDKNGLIAIRVARELDQPLKKTVDEPEINNKEMTGVYWNSESFIGEEVWDKKARWLAISGIIQHEPVTLVLFDHPDNYGFPAWWHTLKYGLVAANPLSHKSFETASEPAVLTIEENESVTFRYRLNIYSGFPTNSELEKEFNSFIALP
ncbi:MAG: PmoA family protein [Balneolaceae bacterium]